MWLRAFARAPRVRRTSAAAFSSTAPPGIVRANGRAYAAPQRPSIVVNLSGMNNDYFLRAREAGVMPNYERILAREGFRSCGLVATSMPSLSRPNCASILTGAQSDVHGITGQSYYDAVAQRTVAFDQAAHLRCPTVLSALDAAGHRTVFLSVHQALVDLLGGGRASPNAVSASIEQLAQLASAGAALPSALASQLGVPGGDVASLDVPPADAIGAASLFCLDLALRMLQRDVAAAAASPATPAPVYFVSTDDRMQRLFQHGEPEANAFLACVDDALGQLDALGVRTALVADHGLNHKMLYAQGREQMNVLYLQPLLEQARIDAHIALPSESGAGDTRDQPLASIAMLHLRGDTSKANAMSAMRALRAHRGIYSAIGRDDACDAFALPADRVGDIVLIGDRDTVFGRSADAHRLEAHANTALARLRSNGSLEEATVPLFLNFPLSADASKKLSRGKTRSFDVFDVLLNGGKEAGADAERAL